MKKQGAINLKSIAEKVGVSVPTVSRALRANGKTRSKHYEKIIETAKEMGYRPNLLVKGIQTGKTRTIGILMSPRGEFNGGVFEGIYSVLDKHEYVPIVLSDGGSSEEKQLHRLIDRRVDGLIIRPHKDAMWADHLHEAIDRHIPLVSVDTEVQGANYRIDFVGTDDRTGGGLAAKHLIDNGHKQLAILTTGDFPQPSHLRRIGFESTTSNEPGIGCVSVVVPWTKHGIGYDQALQILQLRPRPTGIFVTTDDIAPGVYKAAAELGLSIPEDLSVIGFANIQISTLVSPQLTTFSQAPEEIGRQAAELLMEKINSENNEMEWQRISLQPELIERSSTGKAPSA